MVLGLMILAVSPVSARHSCVLRNINNGTKLTANNESAIAEPKPTCRTDAYTPHANRPIANSGIIRLHPTSHFSTLPPEVPLVGFVPPETTEYANGDRYAGKS